MSMAAICRMAQAGVHIEDRALQFGDGIYEVADISDGKLIDEEAASRPHGALLARARHGHADGPRGAEVW